MLWGNQNRGSVKLNKKKPVLKRGLRITGFMVALGLMFAGGVYAGAEYINWDGTADYQSTLDIFDNIKVEKEGLDTQITGLETDKENLEGQVNRLESEKETLIVERDNLMSNVELLTSENQTLTTDIESLEGQITEKNNQISNLESEISGLQEKIQNKNTEIEQLKNNNTGLKEENIELQSRVNYLETREATTVTKLTNIISETNEQNGKGPRYDVMSDGLNDLSNELGIDAQIGHHGQGQTNNELEQAVKDMEDVHEKAEELNTLFEEDK